MPRADVVVLVARGVEESVGGVEESVGGQSVKEESSANSTEVHYDESSVPRQEVPAPRFAVSKPSVEQAVVDFAGAAPAARSHGARLAGVSRFAVVDFFVFRFALSIVSHRAARAQSTGKTRDETRRLLLCHLLSER